MPALHAQILVIGGGPSGAYAAATLTREGFQVTVLEAAKFPRYHIGESMLPSLNSFLHFIAAEEKFSGHGFCVKRGAAVKFNQHKREGCKYSSLSSYFACDVASSIDTDFVNNDPEEKNCVWNVVRSEFDEMLLRHAQSCGATVLEECKVTELEFEPPTPSTDSVGGERLGRPKMAHFILPNGEKDKITFDYLVDASGRNGIMSTKYLKNRRMNHSLQNIACWGYWHNGQKMYMPGTTRENAPWFEALTDESGWGWFIPLHDGTVSVGIVMDQTISNAKKAAGRADSHNGIHSLKDHYLKQLDFVPGLRNLLGSASLKDDHIKSASDFSYAADQYAGDRYRLVGDAAAFIDPFFSSGVHLALLGGLTAATSISASIKGHCKEDTAAQFHHIKVASAYTRFLLVVMSAYKQIRAQNINILSDVDENDFDRAFNILRPVIQGTADIGKKLTDDELQKTMDFCKDIFAPVDPEMIEAVCARHGPELLSPTAPIDETMKLALTVDPSDIDALMVVKRVNARKTVDALYKGPTNLQVEPVDGYIACLECGRLGLVPA